MELVQLHKETDEQILTYIILSQYVLEPADMITGIVFKLHIDYDHHNNLFRIAFATYLAEVQLFNNIPCSCFLTFS